MRFLLISFFVLILSGQAWGQKRIQRFNPVYGTEQEINQLLSFVTSNIKVELSEDQIKGINGYMVCRFKLDTSGNIKAVRVFKSLRPWIDYAIVGAMVRMPEYGMSSINPSTGHKQEAEHQLVFSFGTFLRPIDHWGHNDEKIRKNTSEQIEKQHNEMAREKQEKELAWNNFTKENSKLKYDTKDALKGSPPTLPNSKDGLKVPIRIPTISVSNAERPAIKAVPVKVE